MNFNDYTIHVYDFTILPRAKIRRRYLLTGQCLGRLGHFGIIFGILDIWGGNSLRT